MNLRWQSLILVILILASLTLTRINTPEPQPVPSEPTVVEVSPTPPPDTLSFQQASFANYYPPTVPARKWDVLDPRVTAKAVLIHSLNDDLPLFYYNTHEPHPLASLTKLLTAVVVFEDVGLNKKIPISKEAVATEGVAGNLQSGEVYTAQDLLKIMLLASSNDAAAAFEEYLGGKETFASLLNKKANKIGMYSTILNDASGLSDLNISTARDILLLVEYIIKNHPQIFNWTRMSEFLVQPINNTESRSVYNINTLVSEQNFLGGKTGTSETAGENLAAIFSIEKGRIAVIILGSKDRTKETLELIEWVKRAYKFE